MVIIMGSRIAVCMLSLSVAILSLVLGGCTNNLDEKQDSAAQSEEAVVGEMGAMPPENSMGGGASGISQSSETPVTAEKAGTPTILTAPDGSVIYSSEIDQARDIGGEPISADALTAESDGAEVLCEGFQFFKEPLGMARDNYNSPELFSGLDYLGEMPENDNAVRRVNVGEEICGLRLKSARTNFLISPSDHERNGSYYIKSSKFFEGALIAEFEGTLEIEGFITSTARNSYEPDGGALRFMPTEDKLPVVCGDFGVERGYFVTTAYDTFKYMCLNETTFVGLDEPTCDITGLGIGDIAYARVKLGNIRYTEGGYPLAELEELELLSEVLVHVEDTL